MCRGVEFLHRVDGGDPHPEPLGETPKLLRAEPVDLSPLRKVVAQLHLLQPGVGGYLQELGDLQPGAEHAIDRELLAAHWRAR